MLGLVSLSLNRLGRDWEEEPDAEVSKEAPLCLHPENMSLHGKLICKSLEVLSSFIRDKSITTSESMLET